MRNTEHEKPSGVQGYLKFGQREGFSSVDPLGAAIGINAAMATTSFQHYMLFSISISDTRCSVTGLSVVN
ncbi:hypothetical protein [Pseudomonas putida]|uniref:hypothetical protein n=1 Tax=Pseudomonas putida TaxID=303 RepID=UPI001110E32D|nr:hypothetical protein [Pseudomonas putida]